MPSAGGKLNARHSGSVLSPKGQTYEKQLEIELRRGYADFVIETLRNYFEKSQRGEFDFWGTMTAMGSLKHLRMWNDFGGQPEDLPGLIRFFTSDHYTALPTARIASQLFADLLTNRDRSIQPGDGMDVELLSVAIPICHYVIADKDMENRIKRRGIDREWNTLVFSLSSIEELFEQLRRLC